jgi:uncharacterized membrane protein
VQSKLAQSLAPERLSTLLGFHTLIAVAVLSVAFVAPALFFETPDTQSQGATSKAKIRQVLEDRTQSGARGTEYYQLLEVELDGQTLTIERVHTEGDANPLSLSAGDTVLVSWFEGPQGTSYFIADHARDTALWFLAIAFCGFVVLIGRWQGVTSLMGMAISLAVILRFIIPGIVSGFDPVTISVIGAATIMASSLFLAHGVNQKTTVALVGTTLGLALTAVLAVVSIDLARLTGLAEEEAATLDIITAGSINPKGLLLAGFIIGALGVLDDVAVAQASAVFELRRASPHLRARELFGRAMNIGRDHIASTVNTLFLAYAGAALPLLIILSLQTEPASVLVNREFMATEIVRTLVGSLGILAAVPLTTALAAFGTGLGPPADL